MATVIDRQSVKLTATVVLLQEWTQGQTLRAGKEKTRSLREYCFLLFGVQPERRKGCLSQSRFCKKLFPKENILIKQGGQPLACGLKWNATGSGGQMHQGTKWMDSSMFSRLWSARQSSHYVMPASAMRSLTRNFSGVHVLTTPGRGFYFFVLIMQLCYMQKTVHETHHLDRLINTASGTMQMTVIRCPREAARRRCHSVDRIPPWSHLEDPPLSHHYFLCLLVQGKRVDLWGTSPSPFLVRSSF